MNSLDSNIFLEIFSKCYDKSLRAVCRTWSAHFDELNNTMQLMNLKLIEVKHLPLTLAKKIHNWMPWYVWNYKKVCEEAILWNYKPFHAPTARPCERYWTEWEYIRKNLDQCSNHLLKTPTIARA